MLKKLVEVMLVAAIVAGVAGAFFRLAGALPISVVSTAKQSTFDVTGQGKVVVVPDQAMIQLGVQERGSNLKTVQENVNKKIAELSKQLKSLGVDSKDIKTTGFNYYPDYQNKGIYNASASVSVIVRDLDNVSAAMDLVGQLGLDNVSGPTFGLSDELLEKTTKEARSQAIDKAKKKAEELASLAGMHLGNIVNVVEGGSGPLPYLMRDASLPISGGGVEMSKTPTPVEPGSSEVSVSVTLSYETR